MSDPSFRSNVAGIDRLSFDVGLRGHMQRVFGYMAGGLGLTGLAAWLTFYSGFINVIVHTPLQWVVMLAPFAFLMFMDFRANAVSASTLKMVFTLFSATMGLSLSFIFLVYSNESIARAFFVTGADFGAMALWGYTTKRDLTSMGAFMMMGLLGIIIASVVNIFLMSSMLQWMVSIASVIIFTGMTAWDAQRIKQSYAESYGDEDNDKLAVFGALSLYLDFINLFMALLRLFGGRRN